MAMTILLPLRPPPMINIHVSRQEKFHLFGRQKQMHKAFSGGKPADVGIWRNKQMSGGLLADATVIWLLFEWIGYHLINFLCHSLILSLATLFLWSNLSYSVNRYVQGFPTGSGLHSHAPLSYRTFMIQVFMMLLTMPLLYEKHEDRVDLMLRRQQPNSRDNTAHWMNRSFRNYPKFLSSRSTDNKKHQ